MPDYFSENYGVDLKVAGYYSLMPYIIRGLFGPICGLIADSLKVKYSPMTLSTTMQMIGLLGPILFLSLLGFTTVTPFIASFYLTMALGLNAATYAGAFIYHLIILPQYAGLIFSIGNAISIIPAIIGIITSGSLLNTYHSWPLVFGMGIACYIVGLLGWIAFASGEPIIIEDH